MAASVGPYRFHSDASCCAKKRCCNSGERVSPPHNISRRLSQRALVGSLRKACKKVGTKNKVVTCSWIVREHTEALSGCPTGSAMTILAPASNGQNSSHNEASKMVGVLCIMLSLWLRAKVSCIHSRLLQMAL